MHSASDRFYDRIAFLYPAIDLFLKPQRQLLFKEVNALAPGKLLEIGVGNGAHLKNYLTHEIIAIDSSEKMIARARKHVTDKIQVIKMNGENLQFPDETFEYTVLSHVIAVIPDPEAMLQEVYRVLKPGGKVLILNHFTPDNGLRYIDMAFERIAKLFHVQSVFKSNMLQGLQKFNLISTLGVGPFSYFRILIYEKNL